MDKKQELAKAFYKAFVRSTRDEKNEFGVTHFYHLAPNSPQWMEDAIHAAHGDIFPNDWVYDACHSIVGHMEDIDPSDWEDSVSDWADSNVDVYNVDRARWLASHLDFGGMVDEAVEELGHSDQGIYGDIGIGQYRFLENIAQALIQAVEEHAELEEDEETADSSED